MKQETKEKCVKLIQSWQDCIKDWEEYTRKLSDVLYIHPESKLHNESEAIIDNYTHTLALALSFLTPEHDVDAIVDTLNYYRFEAELGKFHRKVIFHYDQPDRKEIIMEDAESLLECICTIE